MRQAVVRNNYDAMYAFNRHQGNLKFHPPNYFYPFTEKECIFSHAIAKFQNLVRFENL